jgi:hypothetical protein
VKDGVNEIATRLGSAFAALVKRFLPAIEEGLERSPKEITMGATVKFRKDEKGRILGRIIPHEPRIPTEPIAPDDFILGYTTGNDLIFLFSGSVEDFDASLPEES